MNCNTGSLLQYAEEKIYIITNVYVPVTTSTEDRIRRLIETQKTEFKIAAIVNILYSSFRWTCNTQGKATCEKRLVKKRCQIGKVQGAFILSS